MSQQLLDSSCSDVDDDIGSTTKLLLAVYGYIICLLHCAIFDPS